MGSVLVLLGFVFKIVHPWGYNEGSFQPLKMWQMKRILIVKTSSMGDVIHALPVLHDLTLHNPAWEVDWMVEEPFADLVRANSAVHAVIPVNVRTWRKKGALHLLAQWKALRASLAGQPYDVVLDLQGLLKSAVLACAVQGVRMGPSWGYAKERLAALLYAKRAGWDVQAHAVERLRQLAGHLLDYQPSGPPVFYGITPSEQTPSVPRGGDIWFLHATARAEKKWPVAHWQALAHRFVALGYHIKLPWGSPAERDQAVLIANGLSAVEVLPSMNLAQLRARLLHAGLVVGVDTGITHLAAALYLPLVALFFATPAWRFAPTFNPHATSVGDIGRVPSVNDVFEACTPFIRGNAL